MVFEADFNIFAKLSRLSGGSCNEVNSIFSDDIFFITSQDHSGWKYLKIYHSKKKFQPKWPILE